jgi:hypothetical protein
LPGLSLRPMVMVNARMLMPGSIPTGGRRREGDDRGNAWTFTPGRG